MKRIALLLSFLVASSAAAQPPAATSFTGGTLTSELVCAIDGTEYQETDTITDCSSFSATGGGIFYDDSEGVFKKCQDNVLSVMDTSGTPATADISDVTVTQTELAELETIGATTISAAQWTGLGGATTAGIALWDDANAVAQLVTLGLTATAAEINTPLDGASVTLTEFQELETIGATTLSAAQWTGLGGATTAGIALWDDANAVAQLVTLGLTATASEINTPLDGASVTLAEFQQLETLGATTMEAADWTAAAALVGTNTGDADVVDDTTPQLGAMLDVNTFGLGDGTLELLLFTETGSAVNEITIANAATGNGPTISSTGGDAAVDINLAPKGAGDVAITSELQVAGTGTSDFGGAVTATSFTADAVAAPKITLDDSDDAGTIDGQIAVNCPTATDCDMTLSGEVAAGLVAFVDFDADLDDLGSAPEVSLGHGHTGGVVIGSANMTALTVTADGTGTAEVALPAGSIDSTEILDATIAIADLANGTDGELITWSAAGVAAAVAAGTAAQVLTSNGAGAAPTFQAAAGSATVNHWTNWPTTSTDTNSVADTCLCWLVVIPVAIADPDTVQTRVNSADADDNAEFGIYSYDGATRYFVDSTLDVTGTGIITLTDASAVSMPAGQYWACRSCDNTTPGYRLARTDAAQTIRRGTFTQACSGGTMPATLTAPTPTWGNGNILGITITDE